MRMDPAQAEYFKASVRRFLPDAELYLFGSRAKDDLKGGDIDLLVLGPRELSDQEKSRNKNTQRWLFLTSDL